MGRTDTMTSTDTAEGVDLAALAAQIDVPPLSGLQAQGDLIVIPAGGGIVPEAVTPLPAGGVELVKGAGGHVHLLLGLDGVFWDAPTDRPEPQTLGTLTVAEGATAWLAHGDGTPVSLVDRDAEHGPLAVAPGTYVIRRQREQRDIIDLVAD
jgi:hypothetical protein